MDQLSNIDTTGKMVVLYHHPRGGLALVQQGERYLVLRGYRRVPEAPQGFAYVSASASDNPLIAWASYHDAVDADVRRRIGDMLAAHGKNRWTGAAPKGKTKEPTP